MPFSLKINSVSKPIEDWGVSKAKIQRKNCACDTFEATFILPAEIEGIAPGDIIEIFDGESRIFFGSVSKLSVAKNGGSSEMEMLAKNPWSDLEECVYQQKWALRSMENGALVLGNTLRSRVVLGQDNNGNKIDIADQISDILGFAISCGAKFQISQILADGEMLFDEILDLSCAESLLRVLKWIPNTSVYFDYNTPGYPSINVIPRTMLSTVQTDIAAGNVRSFEVSPRPDLKLNGVSIKYESENIVDGVSSLGVSEDNYPSTFNSKSMRGLVMSVELDGLRSTCQSYYAECETINESSVRWWKKHVPELENAEGIVIESASRKGYLSRELVSGSLPLNSSVSTEPDTVSGVISFIDPDENDNSIVIKKFDVKLISTNAATGTYNIWTSSQSPEIAPNGLAKAIYDSSSEMQYEGKISILGADAADFIGKKISIQGDSQALAQMAVPVVSASQDLYSGILDVNFGPPKHLYPDNIAELFRINRNRNFSFSASTRATGKISASTTCSMSGVSAASEVTASRSSKLIIQTTDGGQQIKLNTKDLGNSSGAMFREVAICYNGRGAKARFLMTEPVYDEMQ